MEWTLWGKKNGYGDGGYIKLNVGSISQCTSAYKHRTKETGWTLAITKFGDKP